MLWLMKFGGNAAMQKNLEDSYYKKLGRKRTGTFVDDEIYSDYVPLPPKADRKKEMHIPGYNFCGPGTSVSERIKRGDHGINELDNACREHDVDYMLHADDKAALIAVDEKLRNAADIVTEKLNKKINETNKVTNFIRTIGLGVLGLPISTGKYITNPKEMYHKLASEAVSGVFTGKGVAENLGLLDPIKFANGLSDKGVPTSKSISEGRLLYNDYIDKIKK